MATANNHNNQQVYNLHEDDHLLSGVAIVTVVIQQRSLWVAGYNDAKELLTIHFNSYSNSKPVWALDFFEHLFGNEPLLSARELIKGVFISNAANLVVPDELYNKEDAENWLKRIHFVDIKDEISTCHLHGEEAKYIMPVPDNINALIRINFKNAVVLPLPVYHFSNKRHEGIAIQCTLFPNEVTVTLHNKGKLQWHKVFDFTVAEDIAFNIKHFCRENSINPALLTVSCDAASGAEHELVRELSHYFSGITSGNGNKINNRWDASVSLANQLLACV